MKTREFFEGFSHQVKQVFNGMDQGIDPQTERPDALPPAEVRFVEVHIEPWPDGRRVRVHITLTPFQQPPNLAAVIFNEHDEELTSADIIETIVDRLVFTLHIPSRQNGDHYKLTTELSYPELGVTDRRSVPFKISENSTADE